MSVVSPSAAAPRIAEALNDFSARFSGGVVTLGSGTVTVVQDPRCGPLSLVFLTPASAGAELGRPVPGDGFFSIEHGSQEGQALGYFLYTPPA